MLSISFLAKRQSYEPPFTEATTGAATALLCLVLTAVFFDSDGGRSLFGDPVFYWVQTRCNPTLIIARHWRDRWWRFVFYGLAASIAPGAITNSPFHELRLMSYPVFLVVLTVPALEWLLAPGAPQRIPRWQSEENAGPRGDRLKARTGGFSRLIRLSILALLLTATLVQAIDFQITLWREGPKREYDFDVPYEPLYDAAVAQPQRPIYLENGMWGPACMNAFWYATVEGRPLSEFVRLPDGAKPPSGAIVLSSSSACQNCQPIQKSGVYLLYRLK